MDVKLGLSSRKGSIEIEDSENRKSAWN